MHSSAELFWLILLHLPLLLAVEVTPDSSCSIMCMKDPGLDPSMTDFSHTFATDVACNDWELYGSNASEKGQRFMACLECESTSTHNDPRTGENDVYWFLCEPLSNVGIQHSR